jgi:hypothetical protein
MTDALSELNTPCKINIPGLTDSASVGTANVAYKTSKVLQDSHFEYPRGVGIRSEKHFRRWEYLQSDDRGQVALSR